MKMPRCVNIDWLEVYALEDAQLFPCDADYFRRHGYFVKEREYGTRVWNQMFVIEDEHGEPWIEVRREPASGDSSFCGLVPESCHLRLNNRACYYDDAVAQLRNFMLLHNYVFKRITRIDICYDFEYFDSGDDPAKFCARYLAGKYAKINQCEVSPHGRDNWSAIDWQTISWGAPKSMVSTKIYNKTAELSRPNHDKTYIRYCWFLCGLISDPVNNTKADPKKGMYKPDIWRIEFSLRSTADSWIVIEDQSGKRQKKKSIPHNLALFDSRDKLWNRFEELAFHYFHFKHFEQGVRKDRCKDKKLFDFNLNREFLQVSMLPRKTYQPDDDRKLAGRLSHYRETHSDPKVRQACDILLEYIRNHELLRVSPSLSPVDVEAMRRTIALRLKCQEQDALVLYERVRDLLINDSIF